MKKKLIVFLAVLVLCVQAASPVPADEVFFEDAIETVGEGEVPVFEEDAAFFEEDADFVLGDEDISFSEEEDEAFSEDSGDLFGEDEGFLTDDEPEPAEEPSEEDAGEDDEDAGIPGIGIPGIESLDGEEFEELSGSAGPEEIAADSPEPEIAAQAAEGEIFSEPDAGELAGDPEAKIFDSGYCGAAEGVDNVFWSLSGTDAELSLTITGSGRMADYGGTNIQPWFNDERPFDVYQKRIKSLTLESGITRIGAFAFAYTGIAAISIPSSVKSIGNYAFAGTAVTSVVYPGNISTIGDGIFSSCSSLTGVTFHKNTTRIAKSTFNKCSSLESITIPAHITKIGPWAFSRCGRLSSVTLKDGLEQIGDKAFIDCNDLSSITIPKTVESIGGYALGAALSSSYDDEGTYFETPYFPDYNKTTIRGYKNSPADHYANNNDLPFVQVKPSLAKPKISGLSNTSTGVKITWGAVSGADGYYLYRGSTRINTLPGTTHTDTEVSNNTQYTYKLYAYVTIWDETYRSAISDTKSIYYISRPVISSVESVSTGVRIEWGKIAGASGYYMYRGSTRIATLGQGAASTLNYTDTEATSNGTKYAYKLYAFKKVGDTIYRSTVSAQKFTYFLTRPVISSATCTAPSTVTVKWGKNAKASGYIVKYVTGSTEKTVTVNGASVVEKVLTGLTKGATYKIYVRSFMTVSGKKYFSTWSAYRGIKVTK